jgi:D-alanyl-D-alanine carboxypeptidase (penicillin-binding protein 5/6)
LALISRYAMRYPRFREIVATRAATVTRHGPEGGSTNIYSHNRLLGVFPGADGIKTGYVKESGRCVVASASRGGWRLIVVLLDSGDLWGDASRLLEQGFRDYQRVVVARPEQRVRTVRVRHGRQRTIAALPAELVSVVKARGAADPFTVEATLLPVAAPVERGDPVGRLQVLQAGRVVREVALVAGDDVGVSRAWMVWIWLLRPVLVLAAVAVGIRTLAKTAKSARRRRRRVPSGV